MFVGNGNSDPLLLLLLIVTLCVMNFPCPIHSSYLSKSDCRDVELSDPNCFLGPVTLDEDIAPSVFRQLCPQPMGKIQSQNSEFEINFRFLSPHSCDIYLVCHKNAFTLSRCPETFNFNPIKEECVEADSFPCSTSDNKLPNPATQSDKLLLDHSSRQRRPWRVIEDKRNRFIRKVDCDKDYIEPHPKYCNKFQVCSNGVKTVQICGPGTNFDPLNKVCDFTSNVDCGSRLSDFGTYGCDPGFDYLTTHPENCAKFIQCENGKLYVKNCGPGTLYNPEIKGCDYPANVECKGLISLEHDIDVNLIPRHQQRNVRHSSRLDLVCTPDRNYIAPHPNSCTQFVECEDGRLFVKRCGPGTAYNPRLAQCDWPMNVRRAIPHSCDKYEQCVRDDFDLRSCPWGTTFDPETMRCSQNYECPPTTTTTTTTERATTTERTTSTTTEDYDYFNSNNGVVNQEN